MLFSVFMSFAPILLILVFMLVLNKSVNLSGFVSWLAASLIAIYFFHTSVEIVWKSTLAGLLSSLPVALVVLTSIWQISYMESVGALKRVVVFVKTLACSNRAVQIMMVNMGIGTLLVSVGATPVSILPPILVAMGYSTFIAVALPALGFDALCTFSLLGAPIVVFSDMAKISLPEAGLIFAKYLPLISTLLALSMLWLVGGLKEVKKGLVPAIITGIVIGLTAICMNKIGAVVLTGAIAGIMTILVMAVYLKVFGQKVIDRTCLNELDLQTEKDMPLYRALSPWLILIASTMVINFTPSLFDFFYKTMSMPVEIIPGQPIKTRVLWNAYTWIVLSTIISIPILKASPKQVFSSLGKTMVRAPKPVFSAAVFFAIAYVMNNSGFTVTPGGWQLFDGTKNMIYILASSSADFFQSFYPLVAGYLGLLGGFITGSEASTIAMFTKYNFNTAALLHLSPIIISAGTAIGGGLASVISPAKLQNAAATIDAMGIENKVIKTTFLISIFLTGFAALLTQLWA
ncbi:L-lactate permease [Bacillota bacterium LX-D]|nr:L-lactate permease [Bacillota bacterium LX-D]